MSAEAVILAWVAPKVYTPELHASGVNSIYRCQHGGLSDICGNCVSMAARIFLAGLSPEFNPLLSLSGIH